MEHKTLPALYTKAQGDQGVVEAVFAVEGNLDLVGDVIEPGAFYATFAKGPGRVKVLDQHNINSILSVIGRVLELKELSRSELPAQLLNEYPEATGAAWAKMQFLLDVPEGAGAYRRVKSGAVDQWSFAYDVDQSYHGTFTDRTGKSSAARFLTALTLAEISPVIFAANPATFTVSAKAHNSNQALIAEIDEELKDLELTHLMWEVDDLLKEQERNRRIVEILTRK